jgi:hypothetical protein
MDEFFPQVLERGHGEIDIRFRHFRTGQGVWMAYKVLKLADETGQTVAIATVSQDVTERRRLEDDLRLVRLIDGCSRPDREQHVLAVGQHLRRHGNLALGEARDSLWRATVVGVKKTTGPGVTNDNPVWSPAHAGKQTAKVA